MSMDIMSHDQAVSSHAAERYVVGELSGSERESFEGHYFDCPDCFEQIKADGRLMAEFLGHAREVLDPEPEKSWLAQMLVDLRRPAPVFVSALLLCALGIGVYQQSVISAFRSPRVEASYFLTEQRAGVKEINVSRKARLSLSVPYAAKPEFVSYQAQITAQPSGKIRYELQVTHTANDTITIGLRADALAAGQYSVVIQGVAEDGTMSEAGRGGPFELKFID
jgi:hypothetical protein